jgi:hypothetical protein
MYFFSFRLKEAREVLPEIPIAYEGALTKYKVCVYICTASLVLFVPCLTFFLSRFQNLPKSLAQQVQKPVLQYAMLVGPSLALSMYVDFESD